METSFPYWVQIYKELGLAGTIGAIVGGLIGFLSSFAIYSRQEKTRVKDEKIKIGAKILATVRGYRVIVGNNLVSLALTKKEDRAKYLNHYSKLQSNFVRAAEEFNKMQALADLHVGKEVEKLLEDIKKLNLTLANESMAFYKEGRKNWSIHDLKSGKKYLKKYNELTILIKDWIHSH